ncbi:MAG: serine hydroxymethyltransferase [Gammaproteobacteria bacterium]|nr:serine hydroxymethyltransferase [Gammaproteobacteria bacterium]
MKMTTMQNMATFDPEIAQLVDKELVRQEAHLELIASENYASPRVMAAQGTILTNKYAEGYPQKRYYGGCEFVDQIEELAIVRAKSLFQAEFANVQPHSGSQANAAVFLALLAPNDIILGMSLSEGGHLTHGSKVNFSGKLYQSECYGLDPNTGQIDYQQVREKALKHRPKMIIAGFSAYSQLIDWSIFRSICDEVGAYLLADMAHVSGLVAAGLYPSPLPYADVVTTTTHKTLRGPRGGMILAADSANLSPKIQSALFPGTQGGPLLHVIAAKAVSFLEALQPRFKQYQQQVLDNADMMAKTFMDRGFQVVSGGTKNHMMLLDLSPQQLTGKFADALLGSHHITVNKNSVPNDPQSPFITSGIRIGTPAITTRGMNTKDMQDIANWIADMLLEPENKALHIDIKHQVEHLCHNYPVYEGRELWI